MLLGLCDVGSLEEAEDLFGGFFPGDALTGRAVDMVRAPFPGPPRARRRAPAHHPPERKGCASFPGRPAATMLWLPPLLSGASTIHRTGRYVMRGRGISIAGFIYLVIGLVVAGTNGYLVGWNIPGNIIEGLVAIVLWPIVIFGVDLHALIA